MKRYWIILCVIIINKVYSQNNDYILSFKYFDNSLHFDSETKFPLTLNNQDSLYDKTLVIENLESAKLSIINRYDEYLRANLFYKIDSVVYAQKELAEIEEGKIDTVDVYTDNQANIWCSEFYNKAKYIDSILFYDTKLIPQQISSIKLTSKLKSLKNKYFKLKIDASFVLKEKEISKEIYKYEYVNFSKNSIIIIYEPFFVDYCELIQSIEENQLIFKSSSEIISREILRINNKMFYYIKKKIKILGFEYFMEVYSYTGDEGTIQISMVNENLNTKKHELIKIISSLEFKR